MVTPMFKRRPKNLKDLRIDTLIGAGTRIVGDIEFSGGLHVDGKVCGNLRAEADKNAVLSVSDSGSVEGGVSVANVVLHGRVMGDIVARERVELGATAVVTGNVHYGLIEMAGGAQINGKLIHQAGPQSARSSGESLAPAEVEAVLTDTPATG